MEFEQQLQIAELRARTEMAIEERREAGLRRAALLQAATQIYVCHRSMTSWVAAKIAVGIEADVQAALEAKSGAPARG